MPELGWEVEEAGLCHGLCVRLGLLNIKYNMSYVGLRGYLQIRGIAAYRYARVTVTLNTRVPTSSAVPRSQIRRCRPP